MIDGNGTYGLQVSVRGCTFDGSGTVVPASAAAFGGGIHLVSAHMLSIRDSVFNRLQAAHGGALFTEPGTRTMVSSTTFLRNRAVLGGAVFVGGGKHLFTNVTILKNEAEGGGVRMHMHAYTRGPQG